MKQKLLNQQNLTRRLTQLLVLIALVLLPFGAWGQATISVAGYISDDNGDFSGVNITTGAVHFDAPTNTLTLTDATITGDIELSYTFDSFIIEVIGSNTLTGKINYTFPGGEGSYSTITFKRGDNTQNCSLKIVSAEYPITGFSDYLNPGLDGFSWYHEDNTSVYTVATNYNLSIAGVAVTSANASNVLGDNETPTVVFDAATSTLTLSGSATITGNISTTLENLTINLAGSNTLNGCITNEQDNEYTSLSFTGNGSLEITEAEGVFNNIESYELASGLYLASESLAPYCDEGSLRGADDNGVSSITISTNETYPIWVCNTGAELTGYTQLTAATSSVNGTSGTASFNGSQLTLTNFDCTTTGGEYAFYIGREMDQLTVNLSGTSTITGSGFYFVNNYATLTFTTGQTPGSFQLQDGQMGTCYEGEGILSIACENGLVLNDRTVSADGTHIDIADYPFTGSGNMYEGKVSFDSSTNTLTLSDGATIGSADAGSDIKVYVDHLIVELNGESRIYGNIRYYGVNQSSSIQINKASNAESASLTVSNIEGFSSCTWGNDIYLSAHNAQGAPIDAHYIHYEGEGGSMESYYGEIFDVTFSTTETNAIWVAGNMSTGGNITGEGIEGTVTYNADENTLTLNGATISTNDYSPSPLIVCNGNLTLNLLGSNSIIFNGAYSTFVFKNNNSTGELTITSGNSDATLNITSECYDGTYKGLSDGFTKVNFNNDLGLFNRSGSKSIQNISNHAPSFNVSDGEIDWYLNEGLLLNATYHYRIDYFDTSIEGHGVEVDLPTSESNYNLVGTPITISDLAGPCTITAYAKLDGDIISSNKAKLFGSNPNPFRLVYDADPVDLVLAPAIEEEDGITVTGIEANVTYNKETGKISSSTLGSFGGPVAMSATDGKTAILNNYFTMNFEVVPSAPTISPDEGEISSTATIRLTSTVVGATIKYKWGDGTAETYTEPLQAQDGTLTAWVEYTPQGENEPLVSDEVTATYSVITDISDYYVAPIANITYTGSAVTPTIVVKETEDAEASLTAGTDYTVSYKQGETAVAAADLINVGTYTVVIAGAGDYEGTTEVNFDIVQADITPVVNITGWTFASYDATTNAPSVTEDSNPGSGAVTYVYKEKDASDDTYADWPTTTAALNAIAAGNYTIMATVAATDNYNSGTGTKDFTIAKATPTIAFEEESYSATYGEEFDSPEPEDDWSVTPTASSNTSVATISEGGITIVGVGTTTITVTYAGDDNHNSATATYQLVVNAKDISDYQVTVDATQTYTYTGSAITPSVTVAPTGGDALVLDTDYTVAYTNNTNAGTSDGTNAPTVTVTGKGNYTGTATGKFTIGKADLADAAISKISFGGQDYTASETIEIGYTGEAIHPTVEEVKYDDGTVTLDASEYTVSWGDNNTDVSGADESDWAEVIITSTGKNFTASTSTSLKFQIVAATATITASDKTVTYNGNAQAISDVSATNGTPVVTYYTSEANRTNGTGGTQEAPTDAGTYYVQVTLNETNYTAEPVNVTFTIEQLSIADADITLSNTELTYNGAEQTVNVTKVMVGTLEVGADYYIVSGNKATAVDDYTLTVEAKSDIANNFKGSATVTWTIINRQLAVGADGDIQFADGQTWASFYTTSEDLSLPAGLMAYIVTAISSTSATLTAINYVPKNVPVFLENNSTMTTTNSSADGNLLQGTTTSTPVSGIAGTVYGLHNNKLMQVTSGSIPAGRAYLAVGANGARQLSLIINEGNLTAIKSLAMDEDDTDEWFTLDGRKLQKKPTKEGLYIKNGKKVVVNNK